MTTKARLNPYQAAPEAMNAMLALETYVQQCGLEPALIDLVKTRASQINGCAYCIYMHTREARNRGETEERLYLLDAWHESSLYTDRERAALAWTDAVTRVARDTRARRGVRDRARTVRGGRTGQADAARVDDQRVEPAGDQFPIGAPDETQGLTTGVAERDSGHHANSAERGTRRYPACRQNRVDQMASRSRRVTAIAGLFYVVLIVGNGVLASWFAAVHDMPWVAIGVGLLAVVALALTIRIIRTQYAADRDG